MADKQLQLVIVTPEILTARAIRTADVKRSDAEEALKKASALPGTTEQQASTKAREIERARRLLTLAH